MSVASALLCCCEPSDCACDLTALSVQWTGGIQWLTKCGLPPDYPCDPPVVVEVFVWDAVYTVTLSGVSVVQTVFGEQTVCDGFGIKSSPILTPSSQGSCGSVSCGTAIVTPTGPFAGTNARFIGPYQIPGGWQVRVLLGSTFFPIFSDAGLAWLDGGMIGPPPPGPDLYFNRMNTGGNCPMVGTYEYDASISVEPGNPDLYPSLGIGYWPSWSWQSFTAGSIIVS